MPNDWTIGRDLHEYDLMTGPATPRKPPQMGKGDLVLFHAVIHVRLFAAAEILGNPDWRRNPKWGLRWPGVYPCRVDICVPLIEDGVRTTGVAPKRAVGRLQAGADFAKLSQAEYEGLRDRLLEQPTVRRRANR
jgi:hypothetical protein